ncbi:MAG: GerMN domain-containing protein [Spirochaetales bacterium]|nr:GerMN domain-containing protein [Spirochaetales bacterium]
MKLKLERKPLILISSLALVFVISISVYFFNNNLVVRVLFFPGISSFSGEMRRIPKQDRVEDDVELLIRELILGPYHIDHLRAVPENTKLKNLLIRDKSLLYVDFSADLIVYDDDFNIAAERMAMLIRQNIIYNFPFLDEITLLVDGQTL